jgi:cation transport regulator ChaC
MSTTNSARHSVRASATWVFGYGSLVDPSSLGATIERDVEVGVDFLQADLLGWGRRWNYGVGHVVARWVGDDGAEVADGTIVALGLVRAPDECSNGVIARVSAAELERLDRRERDYDSVEVTHAVRSPIPPEDRVVTYVPRASAIARYEQARDRGAAAIRSTYWHLVENAFSAFGPNSAKIYRESTPAPDVPIVEVLDSSERIV